MTRQQYRRLRLPYGRWTCADGRQVLFNRWYKPIWQRQDGVVSEADPTEWVNGILLSETKYFYNDGNCRHATLIHRLEGILSDFQAGR